MQLKQRVSGLVSKHLGPYYRKQIADKDLYKATNRKICHKIVEVTKGVNISESPTVFNIRITAFQKWRGRFLTSSVSSGLLIP
jgi:hypothetical protein